MVLYGNPDFDRIMRYIGLMRTACLKFLRSAKGMSGVPLTTNPPFGYMKNPNNKDKWLVDEPTAKVVRQIFDLCISGLGPMQIAKRLKSEKVMTPTEYWNGIGRKCGKPPTIPFGWVAGTVSDILDKQEYCGDTVNFRTYRKSFKLKKRLDKQRKNGKFFPILYWSTFLVTPRTGNMIEYYYSMNVRKIDKTLQNLAFLGILR